MKRSRILLTLGIVAVLALLAAAALAWRGIAAMGRSGPSPASRATAPPTEPEWIDLLDADHAAGWKNITDKKDIFEIRDGTLHIFGKTLFPLRYAGYESERFGDFDLHIEFKVAKGANSGVFLRVQPDDPVRRGFEIQVIDDHGEPPTKHGSGAIYDVVTPMFNMALPPGEWNSYDISVDGTLVVVRMNGWKVIDTDFALMTEPLGKFATPYAELPREGLLALQDHGGEVWYRNIKIRTR